MVEIITNNCYSFLNTSDDDLKRFLWKALRFREKNYFHSRLYKQKLWDGFKDFFKKETGRFLTGLLPEIELVLKKKKIAYRIYDKRDGFEYLNKEIDENFLSKDFPLRDYQVDLVNQFSKYKRGIIFAPTSAGKTAMMISVLKNLPPKIPTLILANKKTLLNENYKRLIESDFTNVGRLYDKYEDINMITCATVQSIHKIPKFVKNTKLIIVDEIHDMMSKTSKKCYNKLHKCSSRLALSATPFKFGGTDKVQKYEVKGYFGPVLKSKCAGEGGILTTKELQDRNILSKSICTFYPITSPELPYAIYLDAVTQGIAESIHFHKIVKKLVSKLKGRTLILVERIAHGDVLSEMIPGALWVRGKDNLETRGHVIETLQKSESAVGIATQGIFNAGINVFVHNLINAAGGKADHAIIQRMGRGLRTADDKDVLNYYDFIFNINEYLLAHSNKRVKILKEEGHEVIIKDELDF